MSCILESELKFRPRPGHEHNLMQGCGYRDKRFELPQVLVAGVLRFLIVDFKARTNATDFELSSSIVSFAFFHDDESICAPFSKVLCCFEYIRGSNLVVLETSIAAAESEVKRDSTS